MDPILNCLSGVCCPPAERREHTTNLIADRLGCSPEEAGKVFDLLDVLIAPYRPLFESIATEARKHQK